MKRVIDSSTAFKWVVPEIDSDKAIQVRDDHRSGLIDLLAPDIFHAEMASSLLSAERKGRIVDFEPLLDEVISEGVRLHDTNLLLPHVRKIHSSITTGTRVSLYDVLYVALAEREGCEFISADTRLCNALGKSYPFIVALSSL